MNNYPPEVKAEIVEVLEWFERNPGGKWTDIPPRLKELYDRWKGIIRGTPDLTDNCGTMMTVPGLSSDGRIFLLKHNTSKAEQPAKQQRTGRPRKGETDKDTLVIAALAKHHRYETGGSIGNYEPATVRGLSKANPGLTTAAVSRFIKSKFGKLGHKDYKTACCNKKIGSLLARWQGDTSEGNADLRSEEYGRRDDD